MLIKRTQTVSLKKKASFDQHPIVNMASFSSKQPVIYSVEHETHYLYSHLVSHSKHLFRLLPVQDLSQTLLDYEFLVSEEGAEFSHFTGVFGNHATFLEIKHPYKQLIIKNRFIVAIHPTELQLNLVHQPRTLPLVWMPWDRVMMAAYLQPPELPESELFELSEYAMSFVKKNNQDVYQILLDINKTIYSTYNYEPKSTNLNTTAYEVYSKKRGVCQDFAQLLICLARLLDVPARYRTGYLFTGRSQLNQEQGDVTHAWAEVFLPYLGWIGLDPTNGCLAENEHIRLACGRFYKDATPTSGAIFEADENIQESLSTTVRVEKLSY
jgi:transglutaminase-like putative cysteine protease